MGKSTLIKGLLDTLGYHLVVHYDKPKKLQIYADLPDPLLQHQYELYAQMFDLISDPSHFRLIFDRAHLGEMVYAPMYRKYDVGYVRSLELNANTRNARLVLLTTSDFSFIQDDGLSIDFAKKEEEQARFVEAFEVSAIADKVLIDVSNGKGGYKDPTQILHEVLRK